MTNLYSVHLLTYLLTLTLLVGLTIEALSKRKKQPWSLSALAIYATIFIWYYIEFFYTPESLSKFSAEVIETALYQVMLFLITFRLVLPLLTYHFLPRVGLKWFTSNWYPEKLLMYVAGLWLILFLYGVFRMNGDVLRALFPVASRAGAHMWSRAAGAGAGPAGFIISSAAYTYLLVCALFVILFPLQTKPEAKLLNLVLIAASLPYFVFMGARNQLLAILMPGYFTYLLFSHQKTWVKILFSIAGFLILQQILLLIVTYRNVGFEFLQSSNIVVTVPSRQKHLGLNMFEELCYIIKFYKDGLLKLNYGGGYLTEILVIIPRAIWPNKPLVGIDYALLRGFGGGSSDIGVFATISRGVIGQGIANFGLWFGSIVSALLMAAWAAWLARLLAQSYSTLRLCLFAVALGLTFNLGRDITLLVLFPVVFGYIFVKILEISEYQKLLSYSYNPLPFEGDN